MINKITAFIVTKLTRLTIEITLCMPPALLYMWILYPFKARLEPLVLFFPLFFGMAFILLVVVRLVDNIETRTERLVLFLQGLILSFLVLCMMYLDLSIPLLVFFSGIVFMSGFLVIREERLVTNFSDIRGGD